MKNGSIFSHDYFMREALKKAQIAVLVYGANGEKRGFSIVSEKLLHPKTQIVKGILANETAELMIEFFIRKRISKQKVLFNK